MDFSVGVNFGDVLEGDGFSVLPVMVTGLWETHSANVEVRRFSLICQHDEIKSLLIYFISIIDI
jgi:hypothetical protein